MTRPGHSSRQRFESYKREKRDLTGRRVKRGSDESQNKTSLNRSAWQLLVELFSLMRGYHLMLVGVLAALGVSAVTSLLPIAGTKIIFDYVLGDEPWPDMVTRFLPDTANRVGLLTAVAVGMVVLSLVSLATGVWSRWHATRINKRVSVEVRRKVFEHAVRLPLHRIYALKSGGVASILREDAGGVGDLVFSLLYNPSRSVIKLVVAVGALAAVDIRLLFGSIVLLPLVFYTHRTWISHIRPMWRDIRDTRRGIDAHATEAFGGMRVVRGFGRQKTESIQFTRNNYLMARQELTAWWWSRGVDISWAILIPTATAGLLWYGGYRILRGDDLTTGDLVMFYGLLMALLQPLGMLAQSATQLQNQLAGLDRVLDLLEEPQEMPDRPGAARLNPAAVAGHVTMRDVGFHYPGSDKPVLSGVDLDVEPGRMIALVGPSGAGKTTFCNLVARFYDPTQGAILLDGRDLRDIQIDSYRRLLGIVEQDIFLFDGTVKQNISYGQRGASDHDVEDAARQANAHDFIAELPEGYNTLIGERGVKLSGGQRQRLAIARAILSDPTLLILDEATSNLDTESERLIQQSLYNLMAGRTTFVIAHRLSTIAHADRILVIENGRIVEQGRHEDLITNSGRYQQMVELQTAPPALQSNTPEAANPLS